MVLKIRSSCIAAVFVASFTAYSQTVIYEGARLIIGDSSGR